MMENASGHPDTAHETSALPRRSWLAWAGVASAALLAGGPARSGNLHVSSLSIVVPFTAGGSVDFWARELSRHFEQADGTRSVVLSKPGADGAVAARSIVNDWKDDSTPLLLAGTSLFSIASQQADLGLGFDLHQAYVPLCVLWEEPLWIAVRAASPLTRIEDIRDLGRQRPVTYGSSGPRSANSRFFAHVLKHAGIEGTHVPYKGMSEVVTQLLGGHVDTGLLSYHQAAPLLESGRLRLLATSGARRSPLLPDVPTLMEKRLATQAMSAWFGLFALRPLPPQARTALEASLARLFQDADWVKAMRAKGFEVAGLLGARARDYVQSDRLLWQRTLL